MFVKKRADKNAPIQLPEEEYSSDDDAVPVGQGWNEQRNEQPGHSGATSRRKSNTPKQQRRGDLFYRPQPRNVQSNNGSTHEMADVENDQEEYDGGTATVRDRFGRWFRVAREGATSSFRFRVPPIITNSVLSPVWVVSITLFLSFVIQIATVLWCAGATDSESSIRNVRKFNKIAGHAENVFQGFLHDHHNQTIGSELKGPGPGWGDVQAQLTKVFADNGVNPGNVFNTTRAWDDLLSITKTPHSLNDQRAHDVHQYILDTVKAEIDLATSYEESFAKPNIRLDRIKSIEIDDAGSDPERAFGLVVSGSWRYFEDGSILVLVPGLDSLINDSDNETLLVQAHYDSASLSHGASDDGIGVVVMLELLRNILRFPLKKSVLLNFDWGEEKGLFGAEVFARYHKWAEYVRGYINLEAGGVGGDAMMFRASHTSLVEAYAKAVKYRPNMSTFGNDALKLRLIKSDTDYSVYTKFGIPGLDIAFTDRRGFYHTAKDSINMTSQASVLHMGLSALATMREIADSPTLLNNISKSPVYSDNGDGGGTAKVPRERDPLGSTPDEAMDTNPPSLKESVFYDIFHWAAYGYSFSYEVFLDVVYVILTLGALGLVVWKRVPSLQNNRPIFSDGVTYQTLYQFNLIKLAKAFLIVFTSWLGVFFTSTVLIGTVTLAINPLILYKYPVIQLLCQFTAALTTGVWIQSLWTNKEEAKYAMQLENESLDPVKQSMEVRAKSRFRWSWYGLAIFRVMLVLFLDIPLSLNHVGAMYRQSWYLVGTLICLLLTSVMDDHIPILIQWKEAMMNDDQIYLSSTPTLTPESQRLSRTDGRSNDDSSENSEAENVEGAGERDLLLGVERHARIGTAESDDEAGGEVSPQQKNKVVSVIINVLSLIRFVFGVFLPTLYGLSVCYRMITAINGGIIDGAPKLPLIAFSGMDIADIIIMLIPYVHCTIYIPHNLRIRRADENQEDGRNGSRPEETEQEKVSITLNNSRSVWLSATFSLLFILALVSFVEHGYDSRNSPYKMRVYQENSAEANCISSTSNNNDTSPSRCFKTTISIQGIDSTVTELLEPFEWAKNRKCFPTFPGSLYLCQFDWEFPVELPPPEDNSTIPTAWHPSAAISYKVTRQIVRESGGSENAGDESKIKVLANVTIEAPETRTCVVQFSKRLPSSSLPPYYEPPKTTVSIQNSTITPAPPLPILERSYFVNPSTGEPPSHSPLPRNRDPLYMYEIFGHKFQMDGKGIFELRVEYTANTNGRSGKAIDDSDIILINPLHGDIICEFDRSDRHAPAIQELQQNLPDWTTLTPHNTHLSRVILRNVQF
ncbi:hypothetical protein H4219_005927 [Mycoemilia scoparia]|uniref:Peptide hydrolase n=1 Tax=Mycoemilia scoparia TaxID=417184 RepID=A0A9W7ZME7_9FUNG|nr:hypothetical protein H4219_005927 [Mycoemilia scoparia]